MKSFLSFCLVTANMFSLAAQEIPQGLEEPKTDRQPDYWTIVEQMPTFPGGEKELVRFIGEHIVYPEKAKQNNITGTVYLSFVVDTSGELTRIKILKGVSAEIDSEAVRTVASMPPWRPGKQNGKPVPVQFNLPIKFNLKDPNSVLNDTVSNENKSAIAYELGMTYFKNNDFLGSVKFLTEALKVPHKNEEEARFARGCAYYNLKDSAAACNDWKTGYHMNNQRAAKKLEEYCGCFYNPETQKVYFENANEERLKYDSLKLLTPAVFTLVEIMPEFPGGEKELVKFLQRNIEYPTASRENNITGTVFLTFVIDSTGVIDDISILRGINSELDNEAIRVVKSMPPWKPGTQNGKKVNVQFNLPFRFSLRQ